MVQLDCVLERFDRGLDNPRRGLSPVLWKNRHVERGDPARQRTLDASRLRAGAERAARSAIVRFGHDAPILHAAVGYRLTAIRAFQAVRSDVLRRAAMRMAECQKQH